MVYKYHLLSLIYIAKLRGYFSRNNPMQCASKQIKQYYMHLIFDYMHIRIKISYQKYKLISK